MTKVQIYTDGSARGNPDGPGGYGVVLHYTDREGRNRPCQVSLYSDSRYLTDAFNKGWIDNWVAKGWNRGKSGPVKNIDLWKRLLQAKKPHQVEFIWVKGHAGHPENERCDKLATSAADGTDLLVDEGLEDV